MFVRHIMVNVGYLFKAPTALVNQNIPHAQLFSQVVTHKSHALLNHLNVKVLTLPEHHSPS